MPKKTTGLWKNKNAKRYMSGKKTHMTGYMGGGGTEIGKESSSYKEYVKKMFGGKKTK